MKVIIALCILFSFSSAAAQSQQDSIINKLVIATSDSIDIKSLSQSMAKMLPEKMIYLKGEYHDMKSTGRSLRSIFIALHEIKGVNYMLSEYSHSYLFCYNLFLKTGDLKILATWDDQLGLDSLSLKRYYYNMISLYKYNLKQSSSNKISFVGIDIDLQNTSTRTNIQRDYLNAIKYLRKYSLRPLPGEINDLFEKILNSNDYQILSGLTFRLKEVSKMHVPELLACFGDFYKDYYLIVNSVKQFRGVHREEELLENFKIAFDGILKTNPDLKPRFFGNFGSYHASIEKKYSFASILDKSKDFRNNVAFIATGYYNSLSTYDKLKPVIWQGAAITGLSSKDQLEANRLVEETVGKVDKQLILMGNFKQLPSGKLDFLKRYDAFLIYNGFK